MKFKKITIEQRAHGVNVTIESDIEPLFANELATEEALATIAQVFFSSERPRYAQTEEQVKNWRAKYGGLGFGSPCKLELPGVEQ